MSDYLQQLMDGADELSAKGEAYLRNLPFLPNNEVAERIFKRAWEIFKASGEDFDAVPDWVASSVDGTVPYASESRNGSLAYLMGYSPEARDARLRNLLEIAEGRETQELDFDFVYVVPTAK